MTEEQVETAILKLHSSLDTMCAYIDQQLAPLKEANGKRIATAGQQQTRMECLKLAIGVACMPNATRPARGDDVARMARTFENFMKGKVPVEYPNIQLAPREPHGRP